MIRIGVTGGIGMGKSAASEYLSSQGIETIDSDQIAREIVSPGAEALGEILAVFGQDVLDKNGQLNRPKLAEIIFKNGEARTRLESILHPKIRAAWTSRLQQCAGHGQKAAAVIIPLLFETHAEGAFDKIICIGCSANVQLNRLLSRGWSKDQIEARIRSQMPLEEKIKRSDFLVWNDGTLQVLHEQLKRILQSIMKPEDFGSGIEVPSGPLRADS